MGYDGRRLVVFMDGTSNTPEELRHTGRHDLMNPPPITNVVRLLRGVVTDDAVCDKPQVIGYFRGVATEGSGATRLIDTVSGRGLARSVLDAYRFISHNLEWTGPDHAKLNLDEIFIFGFSRGAYAARALNGFLNRLGLIRKEGLWLLPFFFGQYQRLMAEGKEFDARTEKLWNTYVSKEYRSIRVKFIGVWDTVGALGIPVRGLSWTTLKHRTFHDTSLTPNVTHACQALAIHEMRKPFKPVFWTRRSDPSQSVDQVWFAGAHANVGGGYERTGLSGHALDWMAWKAQKVGLVLDMAYFTDELRSRNHDEEIAYSRLVGHGETGLLNRRVMFPGRLERPMSHDAIDAYLAAHFTDGPMSPDVYRAMAVHWSVEDRLKAAPAYWRDADAMGRQDTGSASLPVLSRSERLV